MLHVRMRRAPGSAPPPAHATVQVFMGPDRDHLALAGELTMLPMEWDALRSCFRRGTSLPFGSFHSPLGVDRISFTSEREADDV